MYWFADKSDFHMSARKLYKESKVSYLGQKHTIFRVTNLDCVVLTLQENHEANVPANI